MSNIDKKAYKVRGFQGYRMKDLYGHSFSIQKSSLATDDAIWFGVDDPKPKIMARDAGYFGVKTQETTGWVDYPIPPDVLMHTRMHLSRDQVKDILPTLQHFAETGEIPFDEAEQ